MDSKVDKTLVDYFIKETNKRFEKLEKKIEQSLTYNLLFIGGIVVLNAVVAFGITIFYGR